jgi:hypothetical protein
MISTSEHDEESAALGTIDPAETHITAIERVSAETYLSQAQKSQLNKLFTEFADVLTDQIGKTENVVHKILLKDKKPIKQYPYRIPEAKRKEMKKEIDRMLELGVIEPSNSEFAAPVVLVPKKDGSIRFCVDYRKLNNRVPNTKNG